MSSAPPPADEPSSVLHQRQLWETRRLEIGRGHVDYSYRSPTTKRSFRVPFEELPASPTELSHRRIIPFAIAILAALSATALVAASLLQRSAEFLPGAAFLAVAAGVAGFLGRSRAWYVFSCKRATFLLWRFRPSGAEVEAFVARVYAARDEFIASYQDVVSNSPLRELERLVRLRRLGFLDAEEFERIKQEVIGGATASGDEPPEGVN